MEINVSNNELFDFINEAASFVKQNPKTKLTSHLKELIGDAEMREIGTLAKCAREYSKKKSRIELTNCSVDDKKNIIRDEKGELVFTVEALIKAGEEIEALGDSGVTASVESFSTEEDLTPYQGKIFSKFLITKK